MKKKEVKEIEGELNKIIDKIMDKFHDEDFISQDFINYSKTLKQSFYKSQRLHRIRRECVVIGCKEKTIKKSHSIPKNSTLQNISSKGHLLKPEFDMSSSFPKNRMVKVGINNASVFPGFCEKHENIFKSFETDGKIDTVKKAILQTYRTLCRERVDREIRLERNKIAKTEYRKKINADALKSIKEEFSKYPQFNGITGINIDGIDSTINCLNKIDSFSSKPFPELEKFEKSLLNSSVNLSTNNDLIVKFVNIDIHFPISICGLGGYVYLDNGEEKNVYVLLNVMPQKNSTDIICVGLKQDKLIIEKFIDVSLNNPLNLLNMIESFMVNGSDHWYINPDFWEDISKAKQEKILYDILFTKDSFLNQYSISIFDNIRMNIIAILKENINKRGFEISDIEEERISHEMRKLEQTNFEMIKDEEVLIEKIRARFNRL